MRQLIMPARKECTKGCNKFFKVPKHRVKTFDGNGLQRPDEQIFDIVVCRAKWRIACSYKEWVRNGEESVKLSRKRFPWKNQSYPVHKMEPHKSVCKVRKEVEPVAKCYGYRPFIWNLGPTCIAAVVGDPIWKWTPAPGSVSSPRFSSTTLTA